MVHGMTTINIFAERELALLLPRADLFFAAQPELSVVVYQKEQPR
jgi:hypothetical protein